MAHTTATRSLAAAAVLAAALLAASGAAAPAHAEMVVVATTAPTIQPGRVFSGGERLDLPAGATVTLLGPDGRTLTVEGPGGVVPGGGGAAAESAEGRGVLQTLSSLFGGGETSQRTVLGAVRSVNKCAVGEGIPPAERVVALVRRGCPDEARAVLDSIVADAAPPSLFLTASADGGPAVYRIGDRLMLRAQPNFDAYLYCYYEEADGSVIPIFPLEGDAAAARIPGNQPFQVPGDLTFVPPSGTESVACFATSRDVRGELPTALAVQPFTPLPADLAALLPEVYRELGGERFAEARLAIKVAP